MRKTCAGWSLPSVPDVFLVFAHAEQTSKSFICHLLTLSKSQKIILAFAQLLASLKKLFWRLLMLGKSQKVSLGICSC